MTKMAFLPQPWPSHLIWVTLTQYGDCSSTCHAHLGDPLGIWLFLFCIRTHKTTYRETTEPFQNLGPWGPTGPHGAHRAPRGPVGPQGVPWGPMGPHGAPRGPTGLPRGPMGPHGAPRGPLGPKGPLGPPGDFPIGSVVEAISREWYPSKIETAMGNRFGRFR